MALRIAMPVGDSGEIIEFLFPCKVVVKARCNISGAGWSHEGVGMILTLRTLNLSEGAWDSFWSKISGVAAILGGVL